MKVFLPQLHGSGQIGIALRLTMVSLTWLIGAPMLAAAGFMAQEAVSGKTWGQQDVNFENFLLGPLFKQESVELARDAMSFTAGN